MTDIRKLMEESSPLPWQKIESDDWKAYHIDGDEEINTLEGGDFMYDLDLAIAAVNALPAVLEYMKGGHHDSCSWVYSEYDKCTCGYDALAKALGVEE